MLFTSNKIFVPTLFQGATPFFQVCRGVAVLAVGSRTEGSTKIPLKRRPVQDVEKYDDMIDQSNRERFSSGIL